MQLGHAVSILTLLCVRYSYNEADKYFRLHF